MRAFVCSMNRVDDWCFCRGEGGGTSACREWRGHFRDTGRICSVIQKSARGTGWLCCPESAWPSLCRSSFSPVSHWSQWDLEARIQKGADRRGHGFVLGSEPEISSCSPGHLRDFAAGFAIRFLSCVPRCWCAWCGVEWHEQRFSRRGEEQQGVSRLT